jgi:hypothetical protein
MLSVLMIIKQRTLNAPEWLRNAYISEPISSVISNGLPNATETKLSHILILNKVLLRLNI